MSYKEIKIGALYPLTGENQYIGRSIRQALEFYIHLVNHHDELSYPFELRVPRLGCAKIRLIWGDTEGDPIVAQSEARRLIEEEGVTSIIGCYQSTVTAAVSLLTEALQIPLLCPDADAKMLTERGLKWFFRTGPDDTVYHKVFFDMLEQKGFYNSTIGILAENSLLGQDEVQAVMNLSYRYRYSVTALELYDTNSPITRYNLRSIKDANSNFLFISQFQGDAVRTIRILKAVNFYPMAVFDQIGSSTSEEFLKALGNDADYIISAVAWDKELTKKLPLARKVNHMFKSIYGDDFNNVNALSFTGLYVLIDAIDRAVAINPSAMRSALIDTDISGSRLILPWKGLGFDKNNQNIFADSMLVQIFNETPSIVWPDYIAETNVVLPAIPWFRY